MNNDRRAPVNPGSTEMMSTIGIEKDCICAPRIKYNNSVTRMIIISEDKMSSPVFSLKSEIVFIFSGFSKNTRASFLLCR